MKLYTQTPHELWMRPVDARFKSQGHNALIIENGFWHTVAFILHLQSANLTQRFQVSPGYALIILG